MSRLKGTRRGAIGGGRQQEVGARQKPGGKGKVERGRMKYGGEEERERERVRSGSRGEGEEEAWSNVGAISQSTSDGSNRHTKRVGVIFKTEDGTPAGILNNRWWPGGRWGVG